MADINKIAVKITGDESSLNKATKKAKKDLGSLEKSAAGVGKALDFGDIVKGSALGNLVSNMISAAFREITQELDGAIKRFDALNNYSKVMSNLGVATGSSSQSIAILDQKLRGLPTSLDAAALGVQRLTAVNGNIEASTDAFLAFNNAILAGGAATETQETAMEQLIQAYSKGKADAQEWRALLIAMPAQMKQIAQAMGYTSSALGGDLQTALQNGTASMDDFALTAIRLNKEGGNGFASFEKQARNATNGVQTSIKNVQIALQRGMANIMSALGQSGISSFFAGLVNVIDTASNYIAAFVKIIKEAVAWVAALFGWGGKGSTDEIVQATEAIGDAGAGAGQIASSMGEAADNAKKLKKQLAAFDEMNVLQEKETDSGSGSGTGAGAGGGMIDYKWDTTQLDDAGKKIDELVEKIKKGFEKAFGAWDFDKIGKSLQKFAKQVQKFLEPIGKILSDIWNEYLAPFINWAGNDLFPAFLNALGGALEFLGAIIGALWDNWLEPFITNFLKPIAEFTGGVIVTVLNAIGDALSWIAQQQGIISFITDLTGTLAALAAGAITLNTVIGLVNGTLAAFGLINEGIPMLLQGTAIEMAGVSASSAIFNGTISAGTAIVGAFKAAMEFLTSTLGVAVLAVGALVAIYEVVKFAIESNIEAAHRYKDNTELTTDAINRAAQASRDQKDAIESVSNSQLAATDAELRLLELTQDATAKREKYATMLNSGKYSQEELTKAELEAEIAEGRLEAQMKTLSEKVTEAANAQDDYHDAVMREISATMEAELRQKMMTASYDDIYSALVDLTTGTHTFALESGESYTLTAEEADAMAANILDALDKSGGGFSSWLDDQIKVGADIRALFHQIRDDAFATWDQMEPAGDNFDNGVARGILRNKWVVENAAAELANAGRISYEKALQIKSPSRVMAKAGGYFAEGVGKGIEAGTAELERTAAGLGNAMVTAFNTAPKFKGLDTPDIAGKFDDLTARASATVETTNATTNEAIDNLASAVEKLATEGQRVTVKIGEETLYDKIVDGINGASLMRNRSVINL